VAVATIPTKNVDNVFDFSTIDDRILLAASVFTQTGLFGTLAPNAFVTGAAASTADHRIIYNSATGALSYDKDTGAGACGVAGRPHLAIGPAEPASTAAPPSAGCCQGQTRRRST
jgi:Ca2+-binding RTX toxin-like protein